MFFKQIQITPGIVNNTAPEILNPPAPGTIGPVLSTDYAIIGAAVTLIVGLLIFLTIDWRLDVRGLIWRPAGIQGTTNIPNLLVKATLIATFIFAGATALSGLFPFYLGILSVAKMFFALAIISLIILTVKIIIRPPDRSSRERNGLTFDLH